MKMIKGFLDKLPYIKSLRNEVNVYRKGFPPGHFYSPIVDVAEISENKSRIFHTDNIQGINLREKEQLEFISKLIPFYDQIPFSSNKTEELFYYFENDTYSYSDGIFLFMMLMYTKPKNVIEVGSGFSSALMVDTNKLFFDNKINIEFIEPFPYHLTEAFSDHLKTITINQNKVQDVPLNNFQKLEENDILFIDSTHVSKTGSDVNYLIFDVLPSLKKGVFIHIHDVFFPFEYPESWVLDSKFHNNGFGWNELYLLRAFLMNNDSYEIVLFNTMLEDKHTTWFEENMPLCLQNRGGSIWLKKIK